MTLNKQKLPVCGKIDCGTTVRFIAYRLYDFSEECMLYVCNYNSPIGSITMASNGHALVGLWFDEQKQFAVDFREVEWTKDLPIFEQTKKWLDRYFSGENPPFTPLTEIDGESAFRQRVWKIVCDIPFGQTLTYGEVAKQIETETGKRVSAQAVGGAVANNRVLLVIPCHRVVGVSGSLTGYAGGLDKKEWLLAMEKGNIRS